MTSESNEDCLRELEYYLLISDVSNQVCKKLAESHCFPGERVLAEFIMYLARKCDTIDDFERNLKQNYGGNMPDYLERTLMFDFVHASFPPKHKSKFEKNNGSRNANESKPSCSSLKIGDGEDRYDGRMGLVSRLDGVELYKVYRGFVTRMMDKCCCVQLHDFKDIEGIVHVSQMSRREVVNANEAVKCDLEVFVKVISISGQIVSFSMRDVDQITGRDLFPLKKSGDDESLRMNPFSGRSIGPSGIRITDDEDVGVSSRTQLKRMSSTEDECAEKEVEVELNEVEPAFLQGKTKYSMDMSPVKILKHPEGWLSLYKTALIKERRELKLKGNNKER